MPVAACRPWLLGWLAAGAQPLATCWLLSEPERHRVLQTTTETNQFIRDGCQQHQQCTTVCHPGNKQDVCPQHWFTAGPASLTLVQLWTNGGSRLAYDTVYSSPHEVSLYWNVPVRPLLDRTGVLIIWYRFLTFAPFVLTARASAL